MRNVEHRITGWHRQVEVLCGFISKVIVKAVVPMRPRKACVAADPSSRPASLYVGHASLYLRHSAVLGARLALSVVAVFSRLFTRSL